MSEAERLANKLGVMTNGDCQRASDELRRLGILPTVGCQVPPAMWGFWCRLICCGRGDGTYFVRDWKRADQLRNEYTSGPGVNPQGYGASEHALGHKRAVIVTEAIGWSVDLPETYFPEQ